MNSESTPSTRATQFRQALVATANLGPYVRRRPSFKLVVGLVVAFVIAGTVTGGTVAYAAIADPDVVAANAGASGTGDNYVTSQDGILVGHPFARSASGTQTIDVGAKPTDATSLIEGFGCVDPGHFTLLVDGRKIDSFDDCSPGGSGASPLTVSGNGDHSVTLQTQRGVRFAVWLSWARIPKFHDSSAQKQALADSWTTRDEDIVGFGRFAGCMAALGHPLGDITLGLVPGYSEPVSAVNDGTDQRCYTTEYRDIDAEWQTEISQGAVGAASLAACTPAEKSATSTGVQRLVLVKGGLLPRLDGCPWIG
ncbi:MAG TPA: hypothetical protein VHZ81_02025 [Galbitalea sp.]|jgi:hypothetical protein|nr:hypothetical protein [Galbitalea sp.]